MSSISGSGVAAECCPFCRAAPQPGASTCVGCGAQRVVVANRDLVSVFFALTFAVFWLLGPILLLGAAAHALAALTGQDVASSLGIGDLQIARRNQQQLWNAAFGFALFGTLITWLGAKRLKAILAWLGRGEARWVR